MGVTGWLTIEHGRTVRFVDGPFGTVRRCVAGGVDAHVFTCLSLGGTGFDGVTVRLFFTAGGNGVLQVTVFFLFSPIGTGMSLFSGAHALVRGCGVVWPFLREARAFCWSLGSGEWEAVAACFDASGSDIAWFPVLGLVPLPLFVSPAGDAIRLVLARDGCSISAQLNCLSAGVGLLWLAAAGFGRLRLAGAGGRDGCKIPVTALFEIKVVGGVCACDLLFSLLFSGHGLRPGRGTSTGLAQLAFHWDLWGHQFCWFVFTASATLRVCWLFP